MSQVPDLKDYVITQYGMEEGLPQSTVNDIIQTKDGYIWLATYGGLVRFDGVSFKTYNRSNSKGMRSDRVLHLYEDSEGALWVGTEDGFLKFKNDEFRFYPIIIDSFVFSPFMVKEDDFGTIWLSVNSAPYKIKDDSVVAVSVAKDSVLVQKALEDQRGVWIAHAYKVFKTYKDRIVEIADLSSTLEQGISDFVEFPKNSGEYFIGTVGEGVLHYKDGRYSNYSAEDGLKSRYTWKFYVDRENNLWVTSYHGLSIWNGSGFNPVDLEHSNAGLQLNGVLQDTDGNYWIGSLGDGLFKFRKSIISNIGLEDGLKNNQMLSLTTLNNDNYLFATNCGGVYTYDPDTKKLDQPPISPLLINQCIWSVFQDSKNRIWFGSKILHRSNSLSELGITFNEEQGFDGIDVFAISEDSKGNIWIGALNGVFKYDGSSFKKFSVSDGLSYNDTRVIFEDKENVIWVGTSRGLNKINKDSVETVPLFEINSDESGNAQPYVRSIHQDEKGVMWIGTYGNGIFRLKDGNIDNITTAQGLYDNIVSHIVEDENGNFWMGSNRGISRVSKSDLNAVIAGEINEVRAYSYGTGDGMNSAETNGGFQPSAFMNSRGQIYFPTVAGVAVASTNDVDVNDGTPPPVYIEKLTTNEADLPVTERITIPYDTPYLQIAYTVLDFTDPKKAEFKHRIKGLNNDWIDVGNNREAIYSSIPPGEYTFQVIASNSNGVWNEEGASLAITVIPPFWQTSWFYSLMVLLLITSGSSVYFMRIKKLKKDNERKKRFTEQLIDSQENERRRIASELHDGLGQQILVIKNRAEMASLQVTDPEETNRQLHEIMKSAVSSIGDVRRITHGLRPVHLEKFGLSEAIETLCDQLKSTSKIEWSYHIHNIDGLISKNKEINFFRVIQEATNNIQKHSQAKEASVMVIKTDSVIKTTIWDDGIGFDLTAEKVDKGLGFTGMYERIETLGGTINIETKPGEGTGIKLIIPI